MADGNKPEITSFNVEQIQLDFEDISIEALEQRLELTVIAGLKLRIYLGHTTKWENTRAEMQTPYGHVPLTTAPHSIVRYLTVISIFPAVLLTGVVLRMHRQHAAVTFLSSRNSGKRNQR